MRPGTKNAAEKRKKEIDRKKWQAEKAERRQQRQLEREARAASGSDEDPDLEGIVPGQYDRPDGCLLSPRCAFATPACRVLEPHLRWLDGRQVRCHRPLDAAGNPSDD